MSSMLYKFRELDKFAFDILIHKRLYLSPWETLNDPHEAEMFIDAGDFNIHANPQKLLIADEQLLGMGIIEEDLIRPKVCSLSSIWDSNLLWSHYTGGHSGISIGITLPVDHNIEILNVKYADKVPRITKTPLTEADIIKALEYKSTGWRYEKEVRLVTFEPERTFIENIEIREVIFGLRTRKDDIKLIYKTLKNQDVKFFKTCLKPGFYNLNRGDVALLRNIE